MRFLLSFLVVASACGGAAPTASPRTPAPAAAVKIIDFVYTLTVLEVSAGTTVTWTNQDKAQHTATHTSTGVLPLNPDGSFNLADSVFNVTVNEDGGSGSFTFTKPGMYQYFCLPHNAMRGTVVVK